MSTTSASLRGMFTLIFNDQPLFTSTTWHETAAAAVNFGLAKWAFNCLFVPVPGARISCKS